MPTSTTMASYKICARCAMDTSDPEIRFHTDGTCNHCRTFLGLRERVPQGEARQRALERLVDDVRAAGRGRKYDCIVGVSGGVDSTYVAYTAHRLGLRALAVHVDNGWNSELAVHNIEKVVKHLGLDLYTCVLEWEQFRDLQVAMLRASTPDSELPTDHAIRAVLLEVARKEGVKYIFNGRNLSTEGILPWAWSYSALDWRYLKNIHKRFGRRRLHSYPHITLPRLIWSTFVNRTKNVGILNYVDYSKRIAQDVLLHKLGWQNYGGKHHESIYTRFFQSYILPIKFGVDKRRAHLSVLICTGEMSRAEALAELERSAEAEERTASDKIYVCKKLGLDMAEFDQIMALPPKSYAEYPNRSDLFILHRNRRLLRLLGWMKMIGVVPAGFADQVTRTAADKPHSS